jgi:TolB-like protein
MTYSKFFAVLLVFMLMSGCAGTPKNTQSDDSQPTFRSTEAEAETEGEQQFTFSGEPPKTLAIFPFENNSVTDKERYAALGKGLAAMLITDLSKTGTSLKVIERENIKALIEEMVSNESGVVDESTAVKMGKVLGAQSIAFGSFIVFGKQVRIDARIVNVETSELIMAEYIMGDSEGFLLLIGDLARKIATSFKVVLRPKSSASRGNIDAALLFSKGLDALDQGDKAKAKQLFSKCIKLDPGYKKQVDNVHGLE